LGRGVRLEELEVEVDEEGILEELEGGC